MTPNIDNTQTNLDSFQDVPLCLGVGGVFRAPNYGRL